MTILKRPSLKLLERLWLKHAYDGFPRHVTTPWTRRANVMNAENYLYLLWKSYGTTDMYTSIYPLSFVNFERQMTLNKIFFDIDDEKHPEVAFDSMQKIVAWFRKEYDFTPRVNFSGKKGYHLYIDFDPIKIQVLYFKPTVRKFIDTVMDGSGAKIVDNSAIADAAGVSRVSRIPYSIHPKTGHTCIPIEPDWDLELVRFMSEEGSGIDVEINKCPKLGDDLLELAIASEVYEDNSNSRFEVVDERIAKSMRDGLGRIMEVAPRYYDGRHRMIWAMLVPRLTVLKGGKYQELSGERLMQVNHEVKEGVRQFIEETPDTNPDGSPRDPMSKYLEYADLVLGRLHQNFWSPWNFETFWCEYPDLAKFFHKKTIKDNSFTSVS